jgi:uncharacterized membrane protein
LQETLVETTGHSWLWWRWILTGLTTLALVLSVIMSWHYLMGGSMAGCGVGSACEQVLNSRWSEIAGILPVSGLAIGVYLAILVAGFFTVPATELPIQRMAWGVMLILAGSVAGSAVWFTILQKWMIGAFCTYCMSAHITGLLLAALIIWRTIKLTNHSGRKDDSRAAPGHLIRPMPAMGRVLTGMAMAGILAVTQVISAPSTVSSDVESQDNVPVIDYHVIPIAGSPDAPYIVTLLFDYQCFHCQKIHFMLNEVVQMYAGKLAFVLCPAPLNPQCNPYIPREADEFMNSCELAKISLAVWVAKREVFPDFENWMFTFESGDRWLPRSPEAARAKAVELVGQEEFDASWPDPWIGQYLQTSVQIYGQTIRDGKGGIPKMVFGSRWVFPEAYNANDLVMILQKSLAVPMP